MLAVWADEFKKPPLSLLGTPLAGDDMGGPKGMGGPRSGAPGVSPVIQARNERKTALDEFADTNSIKPETIKKAFKRFQAIDKDHSGMIDYTEFCEVLQCDPSPQGERLFQLFDYEKSGQIDVREFMIALSNFTGALRCINQIVAARRWRERCGLLLVDFAQARARTTSSSLRS